MPITKRAIKKLRHDKIRTKQNTVTRHQLESKVKKARKSPTVATVSQAFRAVDRATKHHLIHKNTAARLKSRLAKRLKK